MCLPVCDVLMGFVRYENRNFLPWSLSYPGLPPLGFLQTKQLISLVVFLFCKIQEKAIASSCLLLATPMLYISLTITEYNWVFYENVRLLLKTNSDIIDDYWRIQEARRTRAPPQTSDNFLFCNKQILGQIGQLRQVVQMQKSF